MYAILNFKFIILEMVFFPPRSECENQVKGFSNARYKKFAIETEAWSFVESTDETGHVIF